MLGLISVLLMAVLTPFATGAYVAWRWRAHAHLAHEARFRRNLDPVRPHFGRSLTTSVSPRGRPGSAGMSGDDELRQRSGPELRGFAKPVGHLERPLSPRARDA